jgi:serine/threonine protein kinase
MGVVYEAEQLSLKRRVALKVLPPALGHDVRLKARFQREAEAAGRLRHPGIVPVISFGDVAGTPFFAMELVEGRSLARVLAELREGRDGGVPPAGEPRRRWALGIAIAMAEALAYAHAHGIVHRDVKPGNILLDASGTPRLSDFGLAQDLGMEGLTQSGESFGSPRYMSPEQAFRRKLPVDQRSDIYSLGVTLYEMLTLRYPYEGATSVEYMHELAQGRVVLPRKADAAISVALESVLLRAMAKEPKERYADASAFAEDLKSVLERRALAPETASRGAKRLVKRPSFWVAVAVSLCILGLTGWRWLNDEIARSLGPPLEWRVGGPDGVRIGDLTNMLHESHVRIELRSFICRGDPGSYACALDLPPGVGEGQELSPDIHWSVSLDGRTWKSISADSPATADVIPAVKELAPASVRLRVSLKDVLGDALEGGSATLHHRLERVELRPVGGAGGETRLTQQPQKEFAQTVFIYDQLPADYPEAVSNADVDPRMRELLTPTQAQFRGTTSLEGGTKAIRVELGLRTEKLPLPIAAELKLFRTGAGRPFARGRFVCAEQQESSEPSPLVLRVRPVMRTGNLAWLSGLFLGPQPIDFVLEPMATEEEVQLLLDLQHGRIESVRVEFEPSRTVARESSYFDRYWNGAIDVTVPLVSTPAAGR